MLSRGYLSSLRALFSQRQPGEPSRSRTKRNRVRRHGGTERLEDRTLLTAPYSANDSYSVAAGGVLTVPANGVLANDVDMDGNTLTAQLYMPAPMGTVTLNPNGSFVYTAPSAFTGTVPFYYRAFDGSEFGNMATVNITVTTGGSSGGGGGSSNQPPVPTADSFFVEQNTSGAKLPVLWNDTDPNSNPLSITTVTTPAHGTASPQFDSYTNKSVVSYTPSSGYTGSDNFNYTISDGSLTASTTDTLTIHAVDNTIAQARPLTLTNNVRMATGGIIGDGPQSWSDVDIFSVSLTAGQVITFDLDSASIDSGGSYGSFNGLLRLFSSGGTQVASNDNGTDPDTNASGNDPYLSYTVATSGTYYLGVSDSSNSTYNPTTSGGGYGMLSGAYVLQVLWSVPNQPPTATSDSASTHHGTAVNIPILSNDSDPNGDSLALTSAGTASHGTTQIVTIGGVSQIRYTPTTGYVGTDSFTYTISDPSGATDSTTVSVEVTNVNPFASADSYAAVAGVTFSVAADGVLANDADADSDNLTANLVTGVSHGTLTLNSDGSFSYAATSGFSGTDSFVYRAFDGARNSANTTVTLTVYASHVIAAEDAYSVGHDKTLTVAAPGLLTNDWSYQNLPLTAVLVTSPTHGVLTLNGNGSFVYVPDSGFVGADSFSYRATNGAQQSSIITVPLSVTNFAPWAVNDLYTVRHDRISTRTAANGVLRNDVDIEDDTLTVSLVSGTAHGTLSLNSNGSFSFDPDAGYTGTTSFTYRVSDGFNLSQIATASIQVLNNAPNAGEDWFYTPAGQSLVISAADLKSNDVDADNDALTLSVSASPVHGTLTVQPNGDFLYQPNVAWSGTDTFTYTVTDGLATSAPTTVSIKVSNTAPIGVSDFYNVRHDRPLVVTTNSVVANDIDDDDDVLSVILHTAPATGTLVLNSDGTFVYTPEPGATGDVTFKYRVTDGIVTSAPVTATIRITNASPVGRTDSFQIHQGDTLSVSAANGVLKNDTDADTDALVVSLHAGPSDGTLSLNGNGSFSYTPDAGFSGTDSFSYRVTDGLVTSAPVVVSISVSNSAPVANSNTYTVVHDRIRTVAVGNGVLANDFDVDADSLTAVLVTGPSHGTLQLQANGSFTYSPASNYTGVDSFVYKAFDGSEYSDSETVTLTVTNNRPWTAYRSFAAAHDHSIAIAAPGLLAYSGDRDSDVLSIVGGLNPTHGSVVLNPDGSFVYTPDAGFVGADTFGYRVSDGLLESAEAIVTIRVFNRLPVARTDYFSISHDRPLIVSAVSGVLQNDSDLDDDNLTVTLVAGERPEHGTLSLQSNGSFTYTPAGGFVGTDSFRYRVSDGAQSAEGTANLLVQNSRPVADNDKYGAVVGQTLNVSAATGVLFNDVDADLDALQAVLVSGTTHGTLSLAANGSFNYTPDEGFLGVDTFRYQAKDTVNTLSFVKTVSISTALVAGHDELEVSHDRVLSGDLTGNDHSVPGTAPVYSLVTGAVNGTLSLGTNGTFTYTPAADFVGEATFTYRFAVNGHYSNTATATISVVNEAPLLFTGTWRASHGKTITATSANGLAFRSRDRDGDDLSFAIVTQPTRGTITLNAATGAFTYVPSSSSYTGPDSFQWRAHDGITWSAIKTGYIELLNRKSSLSPDSYETHSGEPLSVNAANGVTANDYDADGDVLQASVTVLPLHGAITLSGSGAFVYTPDANVINASDSFKYRIWDGADWSDEATVTIAVTNSAPSSPARTFRTHHGTTLTVSAQAGLKNAAVDADGDPLTVQLVTSPSHGTLQLAASGSFVYVPDAGWTGTDSFTWRLSDGRQTSPPIIAQIQVLNNPVDVNDDWFATQRNHAVSITKAQLLRNDADPDDDTLSLSIFTQPTHGTLVLSSAGIWTYTPDENFVGTDTFKYKVNDGASTSPAATVEIDVNNNASQSGDDRFLIPHSRAFTTTSPQILENDYDADGDLLTVSLVTGVSHGTLNLSANGTFTYTPTSGYVGTDSFEYRTSDGVSQGNISLVTFDIRNSAPQIHEQYHRVKHDTVHSVDATSGLRYYSVDPDDDVIAPVILVNPAHGTLNVAANGSWTYTPSAGFVGKDSFTWHAFDGVTYSKPDIVRIEVTNTDSMVTADYYTMDSNQSLTVAAPGILKNDLNLDQDVLTLSLVENVEHGQLTLNANGSFSYSPAAGFAGEDQFTYRLFDGVSASTGKVTLYVGRSSSGVSQLNVRPDRYQIDALKTLVVPVATGLTANDTFRRAGAAPTVQLISGPSHGSLTVSSSGSFSYTPTAGASPFVGIDSFTYRLTDSSGQSATANVEIKVENHAPWSTGFLRDVHQGSTLTVDASQLASVSGDSEGHARLFSVVASPSHGTLTFHSDGHFSYVPDAGYTGLDSFTWRAFDGIAYSNVATATIDVSNERPTLISNSWRTGSGEQLVVSGTGIRATASDSDGDTLSVSVTQTTQHGTLLVAANGTFTYTPAAGYSGRDTFKARVKDGAEYSSAVTFVIDVENALPVATGSSATLQHGNSTSLNLAAYDSDGDALIYEIVNAPDHGTLTYTNLINNGSNGQPIRFTGNVTYTPSSNFAGQDELTFRVTDGVGFSEPAEISINVLNTAPSGRPSYHTLDAGQSLTVPSPGLLGQALDADGDSLTLQIISQPSHGTLTLSQTGGTANGGFSYQPDAAFAGVDSFTWRVRDGIVWSDAVTTTIAVNNTAPVLRDRTFHSNYTAGTALSGGGRRYNYSLSTQNTAFDLENDTVTYQLVSGPTHGTATVSPAGAISYTPTSTTFTGQDSFTVRGFDGYSWSDPVKVAVSVDNEAPLAILDSFTTHHHTNLTFTASQLLGNDYDFDGDTLQIVSVTNGANGTLTQSGNNWVFNPGNFLGKAVLTYVITDGLVQSEPATIEIEVTNAPVWGTDRSFTLIESTYIEFELSGTAGSVVRADGDATTISITAQPSHGSLTSLGDNRWRYTPTPGSSSGYNGSGNGTTTVTRGYLGHDQITFRISDGIVQSNPVTYSFNVIDAMALAEVNGLRDTSITASTDPVLLQTPDLSSGQNPIPAPQLPEANAKIHTVRPGGTATGQLVVPTGATMEFWNGTSWVDVTASSTAIALTGGSLVTISPDGNYSVTGSTAPKGSRSEARFRISKNSLATESRIAIVSNNSAPILASPFLTTAGGSLVSFVRDAEGDAISFTAQPGQPDVMTMSSTTLTIHPNGTYVFSYNDAAPNSEMMPFQFTVRDQFGASTTGTLNVLKLIPKSYVAPIPPAGQTDPPVAGDSSGPFLAPAHPVSWLQASDGGHPSMTFELIGDGKGTYGAVRIENRTVYYTPYGLTVGVFLKQGVEPTTFYYKVTNAIGSWDIGSINIEATSIGGGEIAQFSGSYAVSYYDEVKVAFDTPYGSWFDGDLAANVFIDMPYMYNNDEPAYFQGNVTNKLRFEVRGDILSPIKVSGNADIVSWGGAIKQPVYAGSIRRLIATGGEYIAAFSDSYIEAASQRYTASQQQGLEIETGTVVAAEIGWVSWSILGDAEFVRWKAPITGTSLINSVLANGSLENVITSGGNINSVRADLELKSTIQAGGTIGFGEALLPDYSRSIPEYWVSSRTILGGSVNSLITAGSHINNVRSTAGDIGSIILAGGNIGVVNAEGGKVDSYIGALGRINQVAATDGIDGVIAALLSIGQVWTQASITATVLAGTGINTVEAWNNISGSIRALAGPIRLVSAGTKDSYGHAATGGSISSSVIYAGKSIGSVIARKVINTQGVAPGGSIQVAGGITAGGGYIGQVSAGESVAAAVTAVDDIGSVVAGNSISGTVESQHGAVLIVTATTGAISGQVKAKLNVGDVTAGTDRIGETKAETGSIGNIKATSGKIDGEINGLKGIGNITAGTSILKSITTAGAGASIGHIRAGAATAGNILGAIAANGNILSIKATAVNDEDLPSGSTAVPIVVAPLNGGKPVRQTVTWPKVYAGGDIAATIYAGGGIFDVIAHGRIAKSIHAGAELPSVLGYKRISADITAGKGGVAVTTYGELRGDISAPGSSQVWAYDDISGGIEIADGGLSVVTWGSFLSSSEAVSKLDAKVWAYCEIVGDRIESTHGTASATGLDSIDTKIRGMMSAIATTGGGLAGSLDAQTLNGYLAAAQNSSMSMSTGRSATLRIDGELAAEIKAGGATKAIVGSITGSTKVRAAENYAASAYINVLRDVDHADIYSRRGSIYLEARNVLHTTVTTSPKEWPIWDGGGIAIHADGNISQTVVESNKLAAIYATGIIDQTKVTATHDSVSVAGVRGVQGEFQALDEVAGAGNVSVTSWAQITGLVNSKTGGVKTQAYGGQNTTIYAGLLANVTVWGSLDGQMNVGSARILARNDVNSTITATGEFDGFVEVIAGGNITGAVTTNLTINPGFNRNRYVTLRALGHVTGGAKATEQVAVFANNVSGEYKSLAKGVLINAFGSMTGQARGLQDVIVFAGQNISGGGSVAAATTPPAPDENSAFASFNGSVYLGAAGELSGIAAYAGVSFSGVAAGNVSSTNVTAHGSSSLTSFGGIAASSITTTTGDVTAFAGESAALTLTTHNGNISVVAIGDLAGTFAGSGEVSLVSFGSASGITASGDGVHLFGHHHADGSLTGESAASMESAYAVSGMLDADVAVVLAGHESTANVESRRVSTVVAGHHVSGIVKSTGVSTVVSAARGSVPGGVSATVEGRKEASVIALGGSVTGNVKSIGGSAFAFAGMDVTSTIDGKTSATAVAIQNVSGGVIKSAGPAKAVAFNNVSSRVESTGSYAFVVAGDNVSGNVKASGNAIVAAVSGAVSGEIESTGASTIAIGMDGISGAIKAHRHSVALSFGTIGGDVTASNGCAVVVSVAGGVSGAVDAAECVLVVSFDGVSGKITADQSILVASLAEVTGEIEAEEYAIVIAAGNIGGSSVTAGKSALVASLGNVTSTVTAEDGSALIIALGNVTTTASATEIVAVIALGDVTIHVPQSQDLIVISGGKTDYKYQPPAGTSAAASLAATSQPGASATRDMVLVGTGNVSGSINSGRDAILVSFGTSSAKVTAARDAVLFALNGIGSLLPNSDANVDAGGDAIVISGATARSNVVGGKNAILVSLESASGSTVTAGDFGAVMTLGSGNNLNVTGDDGAFAWTYGGFTGNVTSSAGSAVLVTVGTATQAIVHGKDNALAVTVGSFDGTVTADDEYAGIISLLNALGTVSAGKGAMVVADGSVNVEATADEDLLVWARGNVNGTFNAGRDAAVVSHGTYDAALSADRDIVFAYAGTSLKGSLTAGRWIGDGSTSPPGDPTEIDDVFSHGDILAQILAGTSASSDPYKGRIGTIASIGNAGGVYTAQHINRIRTAGIVTASMQTSSASFAGTSDGSGPSGGSGTTIILQNQSTLATDVPKPVLDPSERDEVLADAAADKADANSDRQEVVVELDLNSVIIAALRQAILDEVAALRAEIREQADELHTAVDTAVDSAQWWTQVGIRAARVLIEGVYQRREAGYLDEQRRWEQFRETAKDILNQGVQNWASLRAAAQTAFEKGDTEMEQQRNRLFASEAGHLQWHENRWLEDKAAVDREIAESAEANAAVVDKVLDGIQLTLDVAGFAPGVGAVPDVINAMISAGRGNYGEALFNLAVAIPFWGDAAKGGKMLAKAGQEGITHADEVISMSTALAKNGDKAKDILKAGDETGNAFGKNLDEVAKDDAIVHMLDDGEDISALGITAFSQFKYASRFGFKSYDELAAATKGMGVEVHHLIEKRFHEVMGQERGEMLSIVLTPTEHQKFTNAWHAHFPRLREAAHIPYNELSPKQIEEAAREIYAGFPEILKALGLN